ncbi:MAG: hypothetical protein AAF202_12275, partial [Pseudomonadota bacterium]
MKHSLFLRNCKCLFIGWLILAIAFSSAAPLAQAQEGSTQSSSIDWDPQSHEAIRNYYGQCTTYLCPPLELEEGKSYVSDSVGIPMSDGNDVEGFRKRLEQAIAEKGAQALKGSSVYVAGVDLHNEEELQAKYQEVISSLGFRDGDINLVLWSVPSEVIKTSASSFAKTLLDR